jgi:glycosyltransferase involved in cell wall biosynthesis
MHIAFITTQDMESPSGLGRWAPIARQLAKAGCQVSILALHSDYRSVKKKQRAFVLDGVHVRYVGQMHVRKTGSTKQYFGSVRLLGVALAATLRLAQAALRVPADAYHVCKPHPMNGLAGLIAGRLRGKPFYVDCDDYEAESNRFGAAWQRAIVSRFERRIARLSEAVTVNTRYMASKLKEYGVEESRLFYVPNGVECARFGPPPVELVGSLRGKLGLEGRRVVLYVGSMALASHPVDLLLQSFAVVSRSHPNSVLLLVGGGEDYDSLRDMAAALGLENALFVGRVPPADVPQYYALADVSVDPVRDEPAARARFPLKIVESLAVGTPVVTGDVGDRGSIIGDSRAGALVAPGKEEALADGILGVLEQRRPGQSGMARETLLPSGYCWEALAPRFLEAYSAK